MSDLVVFLAARLDEDEALASAATPGSWVTDDPLMSDFVGASESTKYVADCSVGSGYRDGSIPDAAHIARHNPARVLADVAAKRKLIERHTTGVNRTYHCLNSDHIQDWQCERAGDPFDEARYCEICPAGWNDCDLHVLAAVYADSPDYESWRP